ncbi:MAG: hypothetical protein HPY59_02350 [Anaerolineae bacterium]|nr:hypothetical protein [Anaerolineae bacterium]
MRSLDFWNDTLLRETGLPGPRGNLELAKAAALEGKRQHFIVVAGLCKPALLRDAAICRRVLKILDRITASVAQSGDRKNDLFRTLRQALGYCWSVVAAALPEEGKKALERWADHPDPDVRWILRENLKKNRLERLDRQWTAAMLSRVANS